jgi:WD40 repeat protein
LASRIHWKDAAFSPDGKTYVTARSDGRVVLWDAATHRPIGEPLDPMRILKASPDAPPTEVSISTLGYSPDGKTFALTVASPAQLVLCDATTGELRATLTYQSLWSLWSDLRLMSSVNSINDLPSTGRNLVIVASVRDVLHFLTFDPHGKRAVDADENNLPEKARQIAELKTRLHDLWDVATLSASDKEQVIAAVASIVGHTPLQGMDPVILDPLPPDGSYTFSPDGQVVLVFGNSAAGLCWTRTGQTEKLPRPVRPPVSFVTTPDGPRLVTAIDDGRSALAWDVATGRPIGEPMPQYATVTALAADPSGTTLFTGDDQGNVLRWELATSRPIGLPIRCRPGVPVRALNVSADGGTLRVTVGHQREPSEVLVWELASSRGLGPDSRSRPARTDPFAGLHFDRGHGLLSPDGRFFAVRVPTSNNEYDLRLMSSENDLSGIPTEGKNLIIVADDDQLLLRPDAWWEAHSDGKNLIIMAAVDQGLHFLTFDGEGGRLVDTRVLTGQDPRSRDIEVLRKRLKSLWPPHELSSYEKAWVIDAVTSIVGHLPNGGHRFKVQAVVDLRAGVRVGPAEPILDLFFNPDGKTFWFLTGEGKSAAVQLWDGIENRPAGPRIDLPGGPAEVLDWHPDGKAVLIAQGEWRYRWVLRRAQRNGARRVFRGDRGEWWYRQGHGRARFVDLDQGRIGNEIPFEHLRAAFRSDERTVLFTGGDRPLFWDPVTNRTVGPITAGPIDFTPEWEITFPPWPEPGLSSPVTSQWLSSSDYDKSFEPDIAWRSRSEWIDASNTRYLRIGDRTESEHGKLILGDVPNGTLLDHRAGRKTQKETILGHCTGGLTAGNPRIPGEIATFSPNGQTVLVVCSQSASLYDTATGREVGVAIPDVSGAWFSSDSQVLVTLRSVANHEGITQGHGVRTIQLWDATSGQALAGPTPPPGQGKLIAIGRDDRHILSRLADGTVQLWDATRGQPVGQPLRQSSPLVFAAFSPDATLVLTAAEDKTARFWDVGTALPVGPAFDHDPEASVRFSPDGQFLVRWGPDADPGQVKLPDFLKVPTPMAGTLDEITQWSRIVTGLELDRETNTVRRIESTTLMELLKRLESMRSDRPEPP